MQSVCVAAAAVVLCCYDDVQLQERLTSTEFELHSVTCQLQFQQAAAATSSQSDAQQVSQLSTVSLMVLIPLFHHCHLPS